MREEAGGRTRKEEGEGRRRREEGKFFYSFVSLRTRWSRNAMSDIY